MNAKLSGYYFYLNMNIYGDFQICISVPLKVDLERFPCTSSFIRLHIQKAYYERRLWFVDSTKKMCDLDPNLYSYEFNYEGFLVPKIVDGGTNPEDFSFPCQCGKYARDTVHVFFINILKSRLGLDMLKATQNIG